MNLSVQIVGGTRVVVIVGDKHVGALDVPPLVAIEAAARLGDDTPAGIRDRCYSLVMAMATPYEVSAVETRCQAYENEAYEIARDAGWLIVGPLPVTKILYPEKP